jgi:hypothetical protein
MVCYIILAVASCILCLLSLCLNRIHQVIDLHHVGLSIRYDVHKMMKFPNSIFLSMYSCLNMLDLLVSFHMEICH